MFSSHGRFRPVATRLGSAGLFAVLLALSAAQAQDVPLADTSPHAATGLPATVGATAPLTPSYTAAPSVASPSMSLPTLTDNTRVMVPKNQPRPDAAATLPPPSSARTTVTPTTALSSDVQAAAPAVLPATARTRAAANSAGIELPSPPPPSSFATDPAQLATQAQQAALDAQAQADLDEQKREQEHNAKSFDKASSGLLPMAPNQIRSFMNRLEDTQNAAQFPAEGIPKGETRIATLSLDPGVEPPQIHLATGYVTTITMVDATGEPWPILDVGVGGNFEVSPTQAGTHIVRIMPLTRVGTGDLSVLLKDLPTPVIFRLEAGGSNVDLRFDARIGKAGPGAKPQLINRPRLEAGDETLTLILENAPPQAAKRLKVGGLDSRTKAWMVGDKIYVRTPLSLLSPAWNASVASADGMTVYEIGNAPVLLMSDNGAMVRAQISRDEDHDK